MTRYDQWSLMLQALFLVAGVGTVVIYYFQLKAMRCQLLRLSESLAQSEREMRSSANAAALELAQQYLSLDYHERVRRPAWHALRRARLLPDYRERLVRAFAHSTADRDEETFEAHERHRDGEETEADREFWAFHHEYHRVLDILGFFTSLSLLEAEPRILRACHYFYDSWQGPLWRLVMDAEVYLDTLRRDGSEPRAELVRARCQRHREALGKLDEIFELPPIDPDTHPYFETYQRRKAQLGSDPDQAS